MSVANINRVTITGNLTRDPELRAIGETGLEVCHLRVAVNARRKKGDEWVDRPNYFDVTVWGARGRVCDRYLLKGSGVAIDGRLEWSEWVPKEGEGKRQGVAIVADNVQFIGPKAQPKEREEPAAEAAPDVPADSSGFENPVPVAAAASSDDDIPF